MKYIMIGKVASAIEKVSLVAMSIAGLCAFGGVVATLISSVGLLIFKLTGACDEVAHTFAEAAAAGLMGFFVATVLVLGLFCMQSIAFDIKWWARKARKRGNAASMN